MISNDCFGYSVSISGDTAIVGAYNDDYFGSAYVFQETAGGWEQIAKLNADDGAANDYFGVSVSVSGDTAIVGAPQDCDNGTYSGSAYMYTGVPTPDLQAASDTGFSDSDNITSDATPTFDIEATPYYRVYRNGVQVSGDYESAPSFTSASLPDGTYEFTVVTVDEAGNETLPSVILSVTIDTVAPSIVPDLSAESDLGLYDNDNLTCDNTPTFDVPGTPYYRFFLDGIEISVGYQSGSFTLPLQSDGTYSVAVIAVDMAGNESALGDPLSVTIETVAPAAPTVAPDLQAASDTGLSDSDNITSNTTPTFDITATGYYRIYRDGVQVSGDYETASNYTSASLPDGTYDFTVVAVDEAGNESAPSPALSVTIDTVAPPWQTEVLGKLLADDGAADDYFGYSVSISGTTAIVGAYKDDDNGDASGSAYIFQQTASGWELV